MGVCGILFQGHEFTDTNGCIKPDAHNDFHVCLTDEGKNMAWQDDYDCKCGCWENYDNAPDEVCKIYWEIKS